MRGQLGEVIQSSGADSYGNRRQRLEKTLEFFDAADIGVDVRPEYERLPRDAFAFEAFLNIAPGGAIGVLIRNNYCALTAEERAEDTSGAMSNAGISVK